jgi:hypothetical protein
MTALDTWLKSRPGRCTGCGYSVKEQGCACAGNKLKFEGQAIALAAHPNDRTRVEAAIRKLAATGQPFSANDARVLHGVKGGVVGATFTALKTEGVIKAVGAEPSTSGPTHGHHIFKWTAA